jgi:hypothetical protein
VNCEYSISTFISGVYTELGSPDNYPIQKLSGWFLDNSNVGKLNNLIGTSISGVCFKSPQNVVTGYSLEPFPSNDELAIYKMLFDYEYFKNESRSIARSSATIGSDWTDLREGDSSIKKLIKTKSPKISEVFLETQKKI